MLNPGSVANVIVCRELDQSMFPRLNLQEYSLKKKTASILIKNYQATHRIIVEKLIDALMEELLTEIGATKDGAA